jgi:hypothetical protein
MCNSPNGWRTRARSAAPVVGSCASATTPATSCRRASRARCYFAGGREFAYHNDPQKTAESRNAQGWTTLGDVGYVDATASCT